MSPLRVFVGREHELIALSSVLDETRAGRGGLVLLAGEAGIGKTRVAEELARRAAGAGFGVFWGRSWEVGGAPAYWPWIQVLRGLLREGGRAALNEPTLASLARLLPELGGAAAPAIAQDAAQERFQLFDAVTSALSEAARVTPLLVVLEDLHAADPSSLAMLAFAARELVSSRLCVLGTVRDHEARSSAERGELFGRIAREATFLQLARFGLDEVRALLAVPGRPPLSEELVREVARATEGHPLFIEEVRRVLAVRGEPALKGKLPVVEGVRAAISARVGQLPAEARALLEAASVLGRDVPRALLGALLEREPSALAEPIRVGLGAGILLEAEPGLLAFSHALVRDALYRELAPERRAALHARAAALLEHAGAPEAALGEVAQHLLQAVSAVGAERALAGAERAARRALSRFAFEDAVAILEQALAVLEPALSDRRALCRCLILLGEARVRLHQDGREACTRAAAIARELSDAELLADAALALGAEISVAVVSDVLVSLLQEALQRLPAEPSLLRARVMARLAGAEQPALDPRPPVALARAAIALARDLGDSETLRLVLHSAGSALADYADPRERLGVDHEMLRLAERAEDRPQAFRARLRLFCDHLELGDTLAADGALRSLAVLADALRRPHHRWYVAILGAVRALQSGRFAEAERLEAQARAEGAEREDPALGASYALHRFGEAIVRHEDAWLQPRLAELPDLSSTVPVAALYAAVWPAFVLARSGQCAAAAARVARLSLHEPLVHCEPSGLQLLTEVYLACGAREQAEAALPYLEPHRGHFMSWGLFGLCVFMPYQGLIARVEALSGRWSEAVRDFDAAIAQAEAAGARAALAELYYEYARAALAPAASSGSTPASSRARGAELCGRGLELAHELGMPGLVARLAALGTERPQPSAQASAAVESLRAPDGVEPRVSVSAAPVSPGPFAAAFTLEREGDVWLLRHGAKAFRLKDSRGLQMLAELVSQPGREVHVLTLGAGRGAGDLGAAGNLGDAGGVLDARAVQAYRERLETLRELEQRAEELGNAERLAAARDEIERLQEQLAQGLGLGGRERRAASVAERARTNVQRRIKDAIRRIEQEDTELGRYLGWTVRTGTFCVFDPG